MLMCGVGAKSVAHLMKFYLLQWEVMKVKFLINSNMTLTVLNLHKKNRLKGATRFYRSRSLQQGQRSDHDVAQLHPLTNVPTKYQLPTPYTF